MRFSAVSSACALAALLALAACSDGGDTSVTLSASEAAAADTAQPAAMGAQTLTSSDGKISIVVNESHFADQKDQAAQWVSEQSLNTLTLLQRDEDNDITLSVNALGQPKLKAKEYFQDLEKSLKENKNLVDLKVGAPTDNRMNYQFTHAGDVPLNENCVAIYGADNLYAVCASSSTADETQLAAVLKNISLKN